jgi:hypothetical protein
MMYQVSEYMRANQRSKEKMDDDFCPTATVVCFFLLVKSACRLLFWKLLQYCSCCLLPTKARKIFDALQNNFYFYLEMVIHRSPPRKRSFKQAMSWWWLAIKSLLSSFYSSFFKTPASGKLQRAQETN